MKIKMRTIVVDCRDAQALAAFYARLLGWTVTLSQQDWVLMRDPGGGTGLSFQQEPGYAPPVWPEKAGAQQKMLHMDFLVDDLAEAERHALACGARRVAEQFLGGVIVFFDPEGHPFCLFEDPAYVW